jgi:hypothetical protein
MDAGRGGPCAPFVAGEEEGEDGGEEGEDEDDDGEGKRNL